MDNIKLPNTEMIVKNEFVQTNNSMSFSKINWPNSSFLVSKISEDVQTNNSMSFSEINWPNSSFLVSKISEDVQTTLPSIGSLQDAGYDIYVPEFTQPIIDKFLEVNKGLYILQQNSFTILFGLESNGSEVLRYDFNTKKYKISKNLMLPTGVQFLFPSGIYGELCNRSSNSKYNINIITGYIDNSHSNNCCFQISKLNNDESISFHAGDRIGQLILKYLLKPTIIETSTSDFDSNMYVKNNRQIRSGNGIGSTGK